jgi:sterol desaturase/sphingolipid hydroxylase (fatty acid hydroxylase superfamily)
MNNEVIIRLVFFFGIFGFMALWEVIAPKRKLLVSKSKRWFANLSLVALNTILLRTIFPLAAVGMADIVTAKHWGFFNIVRLPYWQTVILSVIALDLVIYLQHVMFHALPSLWHLHKVHHTDLDFDVTTGLRFHPLEIILSMGIKIVAIFCLGTPVLGVIIFEILLNGTSMFNHGNVGLPVRLDRCCRLFLVTPNMHRIHHSVIVSETNSNFGFNLSWWDYLFGTYRPISEKGDLEMTIGLSEYQNNLRVEQLHWILLIPFVKNLIRVV